MGFDPRMDRAIQQLGMGHGSKLHLQFDGPAWEPTSDGEAYTDLGVQGIFPGQVGLPGRQGIAVALTVHDYAGEPDHRAASGPVITQALGDLDQLFPGTSAAFNGRAHLDHWPADPWSRGSCSFYGIGQFSAFAGIESPPQGPVHFAGDHTASYCHRATLNGAVESGLRAAAEVARAARRCCT